MASRYSVADYVAVILALRPRGLAWPDDAGLVQPAFLARLAPAQQRLDARANDLLADAFPATAVEVLPEWEASLGLPDPCAGPAATLQQRQTQVVARLTNAGGQSADFFIDYAAALGFPGITIQTFAPFRAGHSHAGDPVMGAEWAHVWQVTGTEDPVTSEFRAGRSAAGEPLRTFGATVLECELQQLKPAHTKLIFAYA